LRLSATQSTLRRRKATSGVRPSPETKIRPSRREPLPDRVSGFKSSGFNKRGSAAIADQAFNEFIGTDILIKDTHRKEVSSAFEAGLKSTFADGLLNFDLAGYFTRIDAMQFFEFSVGGFGLLRERLLRHLARKTKSSLFWPKCANTSRN